MHIIIEFIRHWREHLHFQVRFPRLLSAEQTWRNAVETYETTSWLAGRTVKLEGKSKCKVQSTHARKYYDVIHKHELCMVENSDSRSASYLQIVRYDV